MSSKLRIIPLGGCGEIGKNMTLIEWENQILVIDAGIMFPENDMLGVDAIIPDWGYLEDKWQNVRGVLITHGHEDHIGAIAHLMEHVRAPIYATRLTAGLIDVKLRRGNLDGNVTMREIIPGESFAVGPFLVEPYHVTHSIPDCVGFGITTPVGLIVHTGDYKFDHTPMQGPPPDFAKLAEFEARGVLCLLADSTNADRGGWTPSEQVVKSAFDDVFAEASGRLIIASFASLISRIQLVVDLCQKHGRKLAIAGRSMRDNVKMARQMGYLYLNDDLLIEVGQANSLPAHQVAIMATGSQGEPTSVLGRLATGRHHQLRVQEGDTVVISAHIIPGNEEMTHRIINRLYQRGADVLYEETTRVHVSGHAGRDEMKLLINLVRPKFLVPIHGELRHLKSHARMARELGMPADNIIVIENGTPLLFGPDSVTVEERMPGGYIFVQGQAVGDFGIGMVKDRERLAQAGFFVATVRLNDEADVLGEPQYITEGFLDLTDQDELLRGVRRTIVNAAKTYAQDRKQLSHHIAGALSRFFYAETGLRPRVFVATV